jgi:hypothetical protein
MAVNGLGAEDLPANSSRHVDEQGLDIHAAGGRLIGFYCPSCGYAPRADGGRPGSAPVCAGSKARTGQQHEPARMKVLIPRQLRTVQPPRPGDNHVSDPYSARPWGFSGWCASASCKKAKGAPVPRGYPT